MSTTMDRRDQIIDYLYGELSPAERSAFEASLRQDPALASEVAALEGTRSLIRKAAEAPAAPSALLMKLQREARLAVPPPSPSFWQSLSALLLRPAAGFAFVVAAVVGTGVWISTQKRDTPALPTDASVATISSADREEKRTRSVHEVEIDDADRPAAEAPSASATTTAAIAEPTDALQESAAKGEAAAPTVAAVPIPSPIVEPNGDFRGAPMGAAAAAPSGADRNRVGLGVVGGVSPEGAYGAGIGDNLDLGDREEAAEKKAEAKPTLEAVNADAASAAAPEAAAQALIPVEMQRREKEAPSAADPRVANFANTRLADSGLPEADRGESARDEATKAPSSPVVTEAPKKKMDYAPPAAEPQAPFLANKMRLDDAPAEPAPAPAPDELALDGALAREPLRQQARNEVALPPRPTDMPAARPAVIVQTAPPAAPTPSMPQSSMPRRDLQGVAPASPPPIAAGDADGRGTGRTAPGYDKLGGVVAGGGAVPGGAVSGENAPTTGRFEQAEAFYRSQRYDQAIQEFEGYLAGVPAADAERAAGKTIVEQKRNAKDATVNPAKVAGPVVDGRNAEARHRLAESYERTNRLEQAARAYKALLDQHGSYAYRGAVLVDAAQVEMRLGRLEAARDLLRQALNDTKMGATARTRLAEIERQIAERQRGGAGSATPQPVAAPSEKNFDDDTTAPAKPAAPRSKAPAENLNEKAH